jgi:hypothetical protein
MNVQITVSCFLHKLVEFLQESKFEKDQTSAESLDILAHETESLSTQDENKLSPEVRAFTDRLVLSEILFF